MGHTASLTYRKNTMASFTGKGPFTATRAERLASGLGKGPGTMPILEPRPETRGDRKSYFWRFYEAYGVVTPQLMEYITEEMRQDPLYDFEEGLQKPHDLYLAGLFPDLEPSERIAAYYAAVERGDGYYDTEFIF
jgi:hypothetical protein